MNGKIASLEQQIAGINATIATLEKAADHKADIDKLNKTISDLETALRAALDTKVDKSEFTAKMTEISGKIADLEAADEGFKKQIADLTTELAKKVDQTEFDKAVVDITAAINGEISRAKAAEEALQSAIDEIKNTTIPALEKRVEALEAAKVKMEGDIAALQTGKLDKATFDAYVEETALTLSAMNTAIGDLTKLEGVAKDKTSLVDAINAVIAKFDDYVLKTELTTILEAYATKADLNAAKAELEGRIKVCEDLLAGNWGGKTVQEYIDAKAKALQDQVDNIVNNLIPELNKRVAALEKSVNEVILPQLQFALDYEGGLQAYIDDAANKAYEDAVAYTDEYMEFLIDQLNEILSDIYSQLETLNARVIEALSRIQSVQYVPDYDDLKITTNMSYVYQVEADGRAPSENETEEIPVLFVDQPTQVTYQFLPAQYAQDIADGVEDFITDPSFMRYLVYYFYGIGDEESDDPFTREELKELAITGILPFFDVRPVNTRDDDAPEAPQPAFVITSVDKVDTTTGEITFTVQPVNVASAQYAANGLKPMYDIGLTDAFGHHIRGWDPEAPFWDPTGYFRAEDVLDESKTLTVPVWSLNDLRAYQDRAAFAAQLRLYAFQDSDENPWYEYFDDEEPYIDYENELASPYNVLYPKVSEIKILPEPYKKEEDGKVRPFLQDEVYQTLPYSALRKDGDNAIGEKPEQDPKGYRIILDQAVPVVSIDGGQPMTLEAAEAAGYHVPPITTSFKEFKYYDSEYKELAEEKKANFVETPKVYAEFEMNEEKPASSRKMEVGDNIVGIYEFKSLLGTFDAAGFVEITKPQGTISANSNIVWTYSLDANVDHNLWVKDYKGTQPVETVEGGEVYNRTALAVNIVPEEAAELEKNLGVTIEDFRKATPVDGTLKITTTDETGAVVTVDTITFPGEYPVKIDADGNLTVDIAGFEWDKVYTVTANYELDAALITVTWTITTVDRNRDVITIELPEYAFELNGEDYDADADTYTSKPQDFLEELFAAFVDQKIINQEEVKDYEAADDFKGDGTAGIGGKEGHLTRYFDEEGKIPETDSPYVICGDDYALFYKVTSEQLHEVWEAGEAQVRNVLTFIGQQVEIIWPVTVNIPNYDFLHMTNYTFNTKSAVEGFQQQLTYYKYKETDPVIWWTQVNPSYFTGTYNDQQEKVSFRHALMQYDVAYINLAELAFNVVDEKDVPLTDEQIAAEKIVVDFDYATINPQKALPKVDQITGAYEKYVNLWVTEHPTTVFYYRTNEEPFIKAYGKLGIKSGNTVFELPTRFDRAKAPVAHPEIENFNYKDYYLVRWTPFEDGVAEDFDIVLDENKIYREPLFKKMSLKDRRPNIKPEDAYYVIKNGEWVVGNVETFDAEAGTYTTGGNGYIKGVAANTAYDIKTTFTYDDLKLPVELRKLLTVKYYDAATNTYLDKQNEDESLIPYIVYDYTSEVQFQGVVTIPVSVKLETPWQETLTFDYNINIKGYNN